MLNSGYPNTMLMDIDLMELLLCYIHIMELDMDSLETIKNISINS